MDAFIGRNTKTNQLLIQINGNQFSLGDENSVPLTVSEMHTQLHVGPNEKMRVINLKPGKNYTWVNGNMVEESNIDETSRIALGPDEWSLDLAEVIATLRKRGYLEKKPMSIAHLESVYQTYHDKMNNIQVTQSRFQALRGITGILSTIALLIGIYLGSRTTILNLLIYAILIGLTIFFVYRQYKDAEKVVLEKESIVNEFQKNYVCPNKDCNRFLGSQSFDEVKKMKGCPHCKTPFKEA